MKKKFYTWEECMQLREIKVRHTLYVRISFVIDAHIVTFVTEFKETEPPQHRKTQRGMQHFDCLVTLLVPLASHHILTLHC